VAQRLPVLAVRAADRRPVAADGQGARRRQRALFETLPLRPGQDLTLLYRARGHEDLVFRHELEQIAYRRGARLFYLVGADHDCLSAPALLRCVPDLAERDVYLCASPRMSDAVRMSLREAGLPAEYLHEERFAF
jgi:ferredoxin-NADP reductase